MLPVRYCYCVSRPNEFAFYHRLTVVVVVIIAIVVSVFEHFLLRPSQTYVNPVIHRMVYTILPPLLLFLLYFFFCLFHFLTLHIFSLAASSFVKRVTVIAFIAPQLSSAQPLPLWQRILCIGHRCAVALSS